MGEELNERLQKFENRIDELYEKNSVAAVEVAAMTVKINCMIETIMEIKDSLKTLQQTPARRWETLIRALISAVVASLIGFAFGKFM